MDDVEEVEIVFELASDLFDPIGIPTACADGWIQVTKVMVAKQQHDIVWMLLLEGDDVPEFLECFSGKDLLPSIRIHVIPEEDDLLFLVSSNGTAPELASVHVWYDDPFRHFSFSF